MNKTCFNNRNRLNILDDIRLAYVKPAITISLANTKCQICVVSSETIKIDTEKANSFDAKEREALSVDNFGNLW